jgi:hypothetical protein
MAIISLLATPKANRFWTPMAPRSHARIVRFLDSEDKDEDEDEDEDDDGEPLKAPNFSQLQVGSDESDDDIILATASKLPVLLLPSAELEAGWSTSSKYMSAAERPLKMNTRQKLNPVR